jgi:glycosyltransferase involved in cell wall biosynthesis
VKIAVLIPCLNEEPTVGKVVSDFKRELPEAEIYVFDNGSADQTVDKARQAGARVHHVRARGKGNVVVAMLRQVEADYYVMVDGDDTYPAEKVRELLSPVIAGESDMSIAHRIPADPAKAFPRFHRFGNSFVSWVVNFMFKSGIHDIFSGYRAFNRKIATFIPLLSRGFRK